MGPAGVARSHRRVRAGLRLADGLEHRDLLRRSRAQHVDELARLPLCGLRSGGDRLHRQVARRLLGPGTLGSDLRRPHVGHRAAPGPRGLADRPCSLPRRPSPGRSRRRPARGRRPGLFPGGGHPGPGQHLRHPAGPAAGAGRRLHRGRSADGRWRSVGHGRRMGGLGVPGQNGRGMVGAAGAGRGASDRVRRSAAEPGCSGCSRWWSLPARSRSAGCSS